MASESSKSRVVPQSSIDPHATIESSHANPLPEDEWGQQNFLIVNICIFASS